MDATRGYQNRWWAAGFAGLSMWLLACSASEPVGAPSVVPTASPYAVLPPATIVAKAPPPTPPPALTPRPSPTPEVERVTYRIVAGDNPGSIAARFDISTADLLKANNITNPSTLQIGQTLVIPVTPTPTPAPGAGPPPAGSATPRATSTATPEATRPPGTQTYTVKSGDNASDIATRYAISVGELATLNSSTEAALRNLQIGQQLVVPGTPSSTPAPAPPATATPTPGVVATATPTPAAGAGEIYIVKAGDTALDIAALFGISIAQLAAANDTTPAALGTLKIGQRLTIPTRGVG